MSDEEDTIRIDLTAEPNGTTFTYEGYECSISYNGLTPKFAIDGERIPIGEIESVAGHAGKGESEWRESLEQYIDAELRS